ncbi:Anaphase-promoting complex, cyclosome, subunit 4 [Teratosphaeria destructans]|uniref:Anaphase-promoting complex subunit 4 n=1 Tax=Teratosphaeria destructans TaxID=418781 RepID=A0A9W7SKW1_9PEZI|nr:Anaphase-promoting complex, cyclosome, subunit 4 [Teratosphaeria destructans]
MAVDDNLTCLPQLSEKHLANVTKLVAYCDVHDLVAIATDVHDIVVYRINGQIAFTIKRKDDELDVTAVAWKQDGSVLAVGWNDGTYSLHSGENGRLLSQKSIREAGREKPWKLDLTPDWGEDDDDEGGPTVAHFGWMLHSTCARSSDLSKSRSQAFAGTQDWLNNTTDEFEDLMISDTYADVDGAQAISRLTRTIVTLDVTATLPRLSAIPGHGLRSGPDGSRFSSQSATDAVFETNKDPVSDDVDILMVSDSVGRVKVLQDDTVDIGSRHLVVQPLMHVAHSTCATHAILGSQEGAHISTSFLDLPLDQLGGPSLHVIATNTKRIQNLLSYITQTVRCIQHDYMTGHTSPNRFLNSLNLELEEKQEGNAVMALYHLAMTGDLTPTMKEWLVDIVKETNHKRWDQAVNGMYSNIQNHIFINLLPALDRLSIAAATLRGHAKYHEGSSKFEVSPAHFTKMLDGVDGLRAVAHKVQLIVISEHRRFRAFSKWLRVMIDIGVAGPGSKSAIETEEREVPNLDYTLLLGYIEETMTRSKLVPFIVQRPGMQGSCSKGEFFSTAAISQMGHERTMEALKRLDTFKGDSELESKDADETNLVLNLPALAVYLAGNARVVLESITHWQSKMLRPPTTNPVSLDPGLRVLDMKMDPAPGAKHHCSLRLLLSSSSGEHQLLIHHTTHDPSNPTSSTSNPTNTNLPHPGGEIISGTFHSDDAYLFLTTNNAENTFAVTQIRHRSSGELTTSILHVFSPDAGFTPEKMVVGGRPGKKVCLLIGNGGRQWRALDLNAKPADPGGDEDELMYEDMS